MLWVVEVYQTQTNVFKTAANYLTFDHPEPFLLGHYVFTSQSEMKQAYLRGAAIFSEHGPHGYRAFMAFERFLQDENVIPKPPKASRKRKPSAQPDANL